MDSSLDELNVTLVMVQPPFETSLSSINSDSEVQTYTPGARLSIRDLLCSSPASENEAYEPSSSTSEIDRYSLSPTPVSHRSPTTPRRSLTPDARYEFIAQDVRPEGCEQPSSRTETRAVLRQPTVPHHEGCEQPSSPLEMRLYERTTTTPSPLPVYSKLVPRSSQGLFPWLSGAERAEQQRLSIDPWRRVYKEADVMKQVKGIDTLLYNTKPLESIGDSAFLIDSFLQWRLYKSNKKNPFVEKTSILGRQWRDFSVDPVRAIKRLPQLRSVFSSTALGMKIRLHQHSLFELIPCACVGFCPCCTPGNQRFDHKFTRHEDFERLTDALRTLITCEVAIHDAWHVRHRQREAKQKNTDDDEDTDVTLE